MKGLRLWMPWVILFAGSNVFDERAVKAQSAAPDNPTTGRISLDLNQAKGKLRVKQGANVDAVDASQGMLVRRGYLLYLEATAHAKIVCGDGSVHDLAPGPQGCPCVAPCTPQICGLNYDGTTVGMTRGDTASTTYPVVISPRKTFLLNTRPTIRWVQVAGANKGATYKVSLYGDKLKLLWSRDGSLGPELSYPEQEPPLMAGQTYKVVVSTDTSSSDQERLPDLGFTLLTAEEAGKMSAAEKALQQKNLSETETRFLVANLYASKELYAEAIDQLEALSKTLQEAPVIRMLGDLYLRVGLNREAEKQYLNALSLMAANDVEGQASIQYGLAQAYESLGNYDLTIAKLGEAIKAYATLENRSMVDQLTTEQQKLKAMMAP